MNNLTVVIPLFNEETLINELTKRVRQNIEIITQNYQIILIDDGSEDRTWEFIAEEAGKDKRIFGIKLSRNFGHHYAISAGLKFSDSDWTIVMDGDLQDRPEVIPDLYKKAQSGYEIVFVSRQNRPEKIYYKIGQKLFYFLLNRLSGLNLNSRQANFSIISRKVVDAFNSFPENARFYGSTISWLGFKRTELIADHGQRFSGKPSYTLKKRVKLATDVILSFSERPLKFAIGLGITISSITLVIGCWIILRFFIWGYPVIGWPSLILSTLFTGGTILTVLGIIGVYLGKVFQEVKKRPLFIISEMLNRKK